MCFGCLFRFDSTATVRLPFRAALRFGLSIAIWAFYTSASAPAPATADLMNNLTACAAGVSIELDADLLGSIQTLYDGDQTEGKASFKSEGAFLALIPETDRAAAFKLYLECITLLLATDYQLGSPISDLRFSVRIPTEFHVELIQSGRTSTYLITDGFLDYLFSSISVGYSYAAASCSSITIPRYYSAYEYLIRYTFSPRLNAKELLIQAPLVAEPFSSTDFLLGGFDWDHDIVSAVYLPVPEKAPRSVAQLLSKCVALEFQRGIPDASTTDENLAWLEKYGDQILESVTFSKLDILLNERYRLSFSESDVIEIGANGAQRVWLLGVKSLTEDLRIQ